MLDELIQRISAGDRIAVSQAITLVENQLKGDRDLLARIFPHTGHALRIGITGPPGAGKSSLTDRLIQQYRNLDLKVAVIGVDPTSPFSGGALLGDRIRMTRHHGDSGVFIRSMASRGGHGGLARKTQEVGDIFDAAGYDVILLETVGVGQVELDVMQAADTVLVVLVPESGDEIQMMKAGLMEIGDVFAINKADRDGANKLMVTLQSLLGGHSTEPDEWRPAALKTIATKDVGIDELVKLLKEHQTHIQTTGLRQNKLNDRYRRRVRDLTVQKFEFRFWTKTNEMMLQEEMQKQRLQRLSPYHLADLLFNNSHEFK